MKHAILVMGHGNLSILKRMIEILDDPKYDFYIHIDQKSSDNGKWLSDYCKYARCFYAERNAVYWGHHSMTDVAAALLAMAVSSGREYDYYHLVSGVDMPIKTPNEIDAFFEENAGTQFVRLIYPDREKMHDWRMKYRYPLLKLYRRSNKLLMNAQKLLYSRIIRLPRRPGTSILRDKGWRVYAGDEWFSITDSLAKELVAMEKDMLPFWQDCYAADETYVPTILMHLPEYSKNQSDYPTREIDWSRGRPYVWQVEDYSVLIHSKALFARKFDPNNTAIADMLYDVLITRKTQQANYE